jgi:hypothetical protein
MSPVRIWFWTPFSCLMSFVLLLNISRQMSVENLKLCHDHLLWCSFHFIILCRSMAYCLCQGFTYYPNSQSLLKIPGARRVTWIKFNSYDPYILSTMVQNCCSYELAHWDLFTVICITDDIVRQTANKLILIITTYTMSLSKIVMISGVASFLGAWGEKSQGLSLTHYELEKSWNNLFNFLLLGWMI